MASFLVTGGAGFIGSAFIRNLLANSYEDLYPEVDRVFIVDSLTYAGSTKKLQGCLDNKRVEFIRANICDEQILRSLIPKSDYIINFAAESHVDNSIKDAQSFIETNIGGVHNLLDQLRHFPEKRFMQISTDEVYGSIEVGSATEEHSIKPNSPYSASKASADLLVRAFTITFGLNTVISRSANNYGIFQNSEKLIPLLIKNAIENKDLPIYGNGQNIREWIHVDDNCRAIATILKFGKKGGTYNIGGEQRTNIEIAKLILNGIQGSTSDITFVKDRLGHDFRYSVNDSKVKSLGYKPKKNLDDSIYELVHWYSERMVGCDG